MKTILIAPKLMGHLKIISFPPIIPMFNPAGVGVSGAINSFSVLMDDYYTFKGLKSAYCIKLLFAVRGNPGNEDYFDRTEIDGSLENNFFSTNYSNVQPRWGWWCPRYGC